MWLLTKVLVLSVCVWGYDFQFDLVTAALTPTAVFELTLLASNDKFTSVHHS